MGATTAIVLVPALWHLLPAFVSNIADISSPDLTNICRVIPSDTHDQSCTCLNRLCRQAFTVDRSLGNILGLGCLLGNNPIQRLDGLGAAYFKDSSQILS